MRGIYPSVWFDSDSVRSFGIKLNDSTYWHQCSCFSIISIFIYLSKFSFFCLENLFLVFITSYAPV